MKYKLKKFAKKAFLYSENNIICDVDKKFVSLTGYSKEELIGKSLVEVSKILRIDSQVDFESMDTEYRIYIFNKKYEPKEVAVYCRLLKNEDMKVYSFEEKLDFRIDSRNAYLRQIYKENIIGLSIYSFPDLILLGSNQKYLDCLDHPYNKKRNSIGKNIKEIMGKCERWDLDESVYNHITKGKAYHEDEVRYKNSTRGILYFDVSSVPICLGGKTKYLVRTVIDVTEKVLNRELLNEQVKVIKEQKKTLEAIIEDMYDYLIMFDKNGNIKHLNKSAKAHSFYEAEIKKLNEYLKHIEVFDSNGKSVSKASMIERILKGEKISRNKYSLKIDDKIVYIEVNGKPIYDENGDFSVGILLVHDITESIKYEENLFFKAQYKTLEKLVENLDLAFMMVSNTEYKIQYINNRAYNELIKINDQIDISSVIGKNAFEAFKYDEFLKNDVIKNIKNSINIGCNSYCYYKEFIKEFIKEEEHAFWKIICQPILGLNNVVTGILCIAINMTEEIKTRNKMEETLKVQDEIFANVSHELKTPLNVIFSTNQLMELYLTNNLIDVNKEKFERNLKIIRQNCYRFTKLINNIVDISKIDSGFLKLNLSNQNIVNITEDIVQSVAEYVKRKDISIIFDTNVEEKIIACDPDKIERIILNLISNSIKFTNAKGIIFVNLIDKGDVVEISVRDTGIGMNKESIKNIFKRFHQVDKSLSRNAEGSGIGLSLVKSLVELQGGRITVKSKPGEGSVFKIVLQAKTIENQKSHKPINITHNKIEMINIEFSDIYSL